MLCCVGNKWVIKSHSVLFEYLDTLFYLIDLVMITISEVIKYGKCRKWNYLGGYLFLTYLVKCITKTIQVEDN